MNNCWLSITRALVLVLWTLFSFTAIAEEMSTIVYGSFSSESSARTALRQLESKLKEPLLITETSVQGKIYFRLHSIPSADINDVQKKLQAARTNHVPDAWLMRLSITTPSATPENSPKRERVAEKTILPYRIGEAKIPPLPAEKATSTKRDLPSSVKYLPTIEKELVPAKTGGIDASAQLRIPKFEHVDIKIDGKLDEDTWKNVPGYDNMTVVEPDTLLKPEHQTQTRLFYTDEGLYVGTLAKQPEDKLLSRLSSRDQEINRDGTIFYLDTSGQGLYGLYFNVNLGGSLTDGSMLPERQVSPLWDGPWSGDAAVTDDGYSTEMFLPWSMMSMPETSGSRAMSFAVARRIAYLDEDWTWPALPKSKPAFISGFQPVLLEEIYPKQQLAFYPFSAATRDRVRDRTGYKVGTDIFWRPSSNLQLTATINPDFGTVESDDVIVNLTAFETFYPEKRLFFLEGNEIFITSPRAVVRGPDKSPGARQVPNSFTLQPNTLLNTRRIGGAALTPVIPFNVIMPDVELSKPTELAGAIKLTGQSGAFRYGVMAASEEDTRFYGTFLDGSPATLDQQGKDFGILRLLYEDASNGRRGIGFMSTLVDHPDREAKTHGIDFHYQSPKRSLVADAQLIYTDVANIEGKGGFVDINYIPRRGILHRFSYDYFDDQLDVSDLGYFRRNDVITYRYSIMRQTSQMENFRFKLDWLTFSHETNTEGRMVRSSIYYRNTLTFNNSNQLNSTVLLKPRQWDDKTSEGNGDFRVKEGGVAELAFGTDTSKKLSASIAVNGMTEALGTWSYISKGGITYKPNGRFSFDLDFMYRRANDWLVHLAGNTLGAYRAVHWQPGITMEAFLSARQQLRLTVQWVGIKADATNLYQVPAGDGELVQITNGITVPTYDFTISRITTQLRYRWEIAPLSDLFIVYTRGSSLPNRQEDDFNDLFHDAAITPVIDKFVIKLRYRFGN